MLFLSESTILPVNNGKWFHSNGWLGWPCSNLNDRSNFKAHYRLWAAVFHQWLHKYCLLKRQLSLACWRNTYFWRHPTNVIKSQLRSGQTTSALRLIMRFFKNRAQNIECNFGCMARRAVLLKPNVAKILFLNFCEQKFIQHGPITITIDCNGLSLLIFEEKWLNYASGLKSTPNSDSFWVRRLFNVCVRIFCAPNATIFLVYIPAKIKMSFIWKDVFFLTKWTTLALGIISQHTTY